MQLIQITSIPIEYKLRITNAELKFAEAQKERKDAYSDAAKAAESNLSAETSGVKPEFTVKVEQQKTDNEQRYFSDSGEKDIATLLARDDTEVATTTPQITHEQSVQAKIHSEFKSHTPVTDYIKTQSAVKSVVNNDTNSSKTNTIQLEKAREAYEQIKKTKFEYHAGKVEMNILTKPRVDVEYIGGAMYVPPSANPDYEEDAA
ncbi:hypothetical protein FACS1894132_04280 [Clostridia bacterium]|nr:hypothetical protein FACS1894132_04280 [Clostridia bacterium]